MDTSGSTPPERDLSAVHRPALDRPVDDAADHPAAASTGPGPGAAPRSGTGALLGTLAVYTLLRLALVAALTAVLAIFMPLIIAMLFAIIVQLPLAWILFGGPRARVNDAIALASARRRAERSRLQAGLSGDPRT